MCYSYSYRSFDWYINMFSFKYRILGGNQIIIDLQGSTQRLCPNFGLLLYLRLHWWPNIKPALGHSLLGIYLHNN